MKLIEFLMRERGITQADMAKRCEVTASLISRVVKGNERAYPKLRNGIAAALDLPVDRAAELFEEIIDVKTRSGWLRGDAE